MGEDNISGDSGDDELFGGPANDEVRGGDGDDVVVGNFGDDVLLGGKGDDMITGDNPSPILPQGPSQDVCNGQQGEDFAVEGTCEVQVQIETTGPLPQG
jgi:hypothetical protein